MACRRKLTVASNSQQWITTEHPIATMPAVNSKKAIAEVPSVKWQASWKHSSTTRTNMRIAVTAEEDSGLESRVA